MTSARATQRWSQSPGCGQARRWRSTDAPAKLEEYIACGARLGWLIDPDERRAYVYRPGQVVEVRDQATELRGDPELPGLILDLRSIW